LRAWARVKLDFATASCQGRGARLVAERAQTAGASVTVQCVSKRRAPIAFVLLLASACGSSAPPPAQPQPASPPNPKSDLIRVRAPQAGATVASPLQVTGEARGTWYFEADFPITLLDAEDRVLAQSHAQAQGEWMTQDFVPFAGELRFEAPATSTGTLVIEKANPSGLPEHADELRLPVRFGP
jgi:hypothetical protein